jgi:hypothetical protein
MGLQADRAAPFLLFNGRRADYQIALF